jgi:repressor LexA
MELTIAQRKVLDCLQREWTAGRSVESLEHLCHLLGLRSRGALHRHIEALVAAGLVAPLDRHRHGVRPAGRPPRGPAVNPSCGLPLRRSSDALATVPRRRVEDRASAEARRMGPAWPPGVTMRALPRLGRIAAGAPLDAVFEDEPVLVPDRLTPAGDAYVLEVRGDSMSGDGILDGDLVVVEVDLHVRAGEIAVVLVAGEGATLKRFRHEGANVRLIASNPLVADQVLNSRQVVIQGRVCGLMRSYPG